MNARPVIDLVAGARPNFVKVAPVHRALVEGNLIDPRLVHTGQHFSHSMSSVFFEELGLPKPDTHLGVGSGSHGQQTAGIIESYESHLLKERPDATVVFGDINSTMACSLAAVKLGVPVVHVEAGLRSFDRSMPEEINRMLTDAVSDLLLVTEQSGIDNLMREGVASEKVKLVGNVMIDSLQAHLQAARDEGSASRLGLTSGNYGLVTLHRPSNVDDPNTLASLLELFENLATKLPLVFPVHPRTLASAERAGIHLERRNSGGEHLKDAQGLIFVEPQPYVPFLSLLSGAALVLTDSGGVQEETAILGVPCLTLRENTERPITLELGTSRLVGTDVGKIRACVAEVLGGSWPKAAPIDLWDGQAAPRIAQEIANWILKPKQHRV